METSSLKIGSKYTIVAEKTSPTEDPYNLSIIDPVKATMHKWSVPRA
jgi:hypothetical protein